MNSPHRRASPLISATLLATVALPALRAEPETLWDLGRRTRAVHELNPIFAVRNVNSTTPTSA